MGVFWILSGITIAILKIPEDKFIQYKVVFPIFATGWILGAIASLFFFRTVYKTKGLTKFQQEQTRQKYLGRGGLDAELNWWIFMGIPASLIAVLIWILAPFTHTDTQKAYGMLILFMVVFGASMYFCDKMPRRLVFWLGVFGWLLTFVLGYLFFKMLGSHPSWN